MIPDQEQSVVRRFTMRECERLQGLPDNYTDIDFGGKPAGFRRRMQAIGNSMAVNVMEWVGERIAAVDTALARAGESGDAR